MLGTFDPLVEKHGLVADVAKIEEWIKKGAKPTNTIARLLKGQGVKGMDSFVIEMKDRAVKNPKEKKAPAAPSAEAATDEADTEPVADAPGTEEKKEEDEEVKKEDEAPAEEEAKEEKKPEEEK